jgi:hypothetical protein
LKNKLFEKWLRRNQNTATYEEANVALLRFAEKEEL